jgi:hypothetical protein
MSHSQFYLVATVIHIKSLRSQICVYVYIHTYSPQYREAGRAKQVKIWDSTEFRVPRKSFRVPFGARIAYHRFGGPGLGYGRDNWEITVRVSAGVKEFIFCKTFRSAVRAKPRPVC